MTVHYIRHLKVKAENSLHQYCILNKERNTNYMSSTTSTPACVPRTQTFRKAGVSAGSLNQRDQEGQRASDLSGAYMAEEENRAGPFSSFQLSAARLSWFLGDVIDNYTSCNHTLICPFLLSARENTLTSRCPIFFSSQVIRIVDLLGVGVVPPHNKRFPVGILLAGASRAHLGRVCLIWPPPTVQRHALRRT